MTRVFTAIPEGTCQDFPVYKYTNESGDLEKTPLVLRVLRVH